MNLPDGFKKQLLLLLLIAGVGLVIVFNLPANMPDGNHAALPFLNPSQMLFNNDNPLGWQTAEYNRLPSTIFGVWNNLYWFGGEVIGDSPRITNMVAAILRPWLHVKYSPCFSLLFLAFCAWLFFRQLKFNPAVCLFGGFALALNMHYFSCAAWGVFLWNIASGCTFLALAAITTDSIRQWWARALFAGMAIGMAVMEGFDTGAILAMGFECALLATIWFGKGSWLEKIDRSISYSLLVVAFAALTADYTIVSLIGTQIQPMGGAGRSFNPQTLLNLLFAFTAMFFVVRWIVVERVAPRLSVKVRKTTGMLVVGAVAVAVLAGGTMYTIVNQRRQVDPKQWSFSTQWSLPKLETLRLFIPGLMGYHMYENVDGADKSSAYWGRIGEDLRLTEIQDLRYSSNPEIRRQADEAMRTFGNAGYRRHIGSGDYAGLLVMILAAFGAVNSFRGSRSPFSSNEKRFIWFWTIAALLSLIIAYGRHAFLYKFIFELPYFSTTRNPIKFLHLFFITVAILSAYGAEALWRCYLRGTAPRGAFEKKWISFWVGAIAISIFGLFVLSSKKEDLVHYLSLSGVVPGTEQELATFCIKEVMWYVFFLIVSVGVLIAIIRGVWAGKRAKWAWIVMGVVLLCDLARADGYWLKYYNYKEKYALNPVLDFLRKEPYDKKSTAKLAPFGGYDISGCPQPHGPLDNNFYAVCNEWLQNQFPYYNIHALDIVQAPRTAEMDMNMAGAFQPKTTAEFPLCARLWQLSSTRYILCWAGFLTNSIYTGSPSLQGLDPSGNAFQIRTRLRVALGPHVKIPTTSADLTVEPDDHGDFALVEYANALPPAKLYSNWQTVDGTQATLSLLRSPGFDPQKSVLVAKETPVPAPTAPNAEAGSVKIEDYHPKYIKLQANANVGSVLLLNDHTSPHWQVWVDNKQAPVLQCNYIVRGVYLEKGQHTVEFKFRPSGLGSLYVTLAGLGVGILMAGFVIVTNRGRKDESAGTPTETKTAAKPAA